MFFHLISDAETHCPENCAVQAKLKDVKNMNWCKFIADFLHDAFSNKMYQKGCRLHLMVFLYYSFANTPSSLSMHGNHDGDIVATTIITRWQLPTFHDGN